MASQEHLEILKQGVEVWNKWREENPEVKPDLQGAFVLIDKLKHVELQETNLKEVDLGGVSLIEANLWGADLRKAKFAFADLKGAILTYANLESAQLHYANLEGAILVKANLRNANFKEANLRRAVLSSAFLQGTFFQKANLEEASFNKKTYLNEANLKKIRIDKFNLGYLPAEYIVTAKKTKYSEFIIGNNEEINIIRSIEFPPEYHQAGISILNYFGTILHKKYPDTNATIQIKQDGLKVTMIIDPVGGEKEVIEKALNDYGLVVTAKMTPEEFYPSNPYEAMALRNKLEMAEMELRQTRQLLQFQEREAKKQDVRIETLLAIVGQAVQKQPVIVSPTIIVNGDKTDINAGKDVSFAKDQAKAITMKDSQTGIVGDGADVEGNIK